MKKAFSFIALLLAAALLLTGCGFSVLRYEHAEKYSVGNANIKGTVENLEVDWLDGGVEIVYANQSQVTVSETAEKSLAESEQLRWWLDGTTLRVQYAEVGPKWIAVEKQLTVTLPAGTVLKNARISCTSGCIQAAPFYGENVHFSATSGSIHTECAASSLNLYATTGNITLRGAANTIGLSATTGRIDAVIEHADDLAAFLLTGSLNLDLDGVRQANVSATTARIDILTDDVNALVIKNTTGPVSVRCRRAPHDALVSSTAGSISLALPADAGFTAQADTVSGGIHVNLPAIKTGNVYVFGDGAAQITLSSVSGGITIEEYRE